MEVSTEKCTLNLFVTKWTQSFSFPSFFVAVEKGDLIGTVSLGPKMSQARPKCWTSKQRIADSHNPLLLHN